MMKGAICAPAICLLFIGMTSVSHAGNAEVYRDGSRSWQAGVDGVVIDWSPDGSIRRVYSKYATPVEFADRRGISKAQVISEEKAKAAIIRFMHQSVSSKVTVEEVQN